jgi:BioD-like phosphotransacetylase family protein
VIKDNTDLLSNISEAIKFCEATQTKLSKMLDASKGLVSLNLLDTIESCKNSIEEIASRFGGVSSEKDFNRVF